MSNVPAASVHRMTVRRSAIPRENRRLFTCCTDTETPFSVLWNNSTTAQSRFAVLGTPAEVIDQIVEHVTAGRADEHTAQVAEMVRAMVGLSDDVIDGLKMLRQELDYTTLKFRRLEPPSEAPTLHCPGNP